MPCKGCCNHLQKMAVLETAIFHLSNDSLAPSQLGIAAASVSPLPPTQDYDAKLALANVNTKQTPGILPVNAANQNLSSPKRKVISDKLVFSESSAILLDINTATGWPSLNPNQHCFSVATDATEQTWASVTKGRKWTPPLPNAELRQENRFLPLLRMPGSPPADMIAARPTVRNNPLSPKQSITTLIVGDWSVENIKPGKQRNSKTYCFPQDEIPDLANRITELLNSHQAVTKIILHVGTHVISKKQSEVLKADFSKLLNMLASLDIEAYISGPLPSNQGIERFSRLLGINSWLSTACPLHKVNFIDNFNLFWQHRHLFTMDGRSMNAVGKALFTPQLNYRTSDRPSSVGCIRFGVPNTPSPREQLRCPPPLLHPPLIHLSSFLTLCFWWRPGSTLAIESLYSMRQPPQIWALLMSPEQAKKEAEVLLSFSPICFNASRCSSAIFYHLNILQSS